MTYEVLFPGYARTGSIPKSPPAVLVVSHERSGSHFLMNTLAACYGCISQPWVNFDGPSLPLNYYSPTAVRDHLLALAARPRLPIVKSHHPAGFFADELPRLAERYVLFSICRNPVDVLLSYWRFMHRWPWFEGPKVADPLTFARAAPCGGMLRYQLQQHANLILRWAAHVESWLAAAETVRRVVVVRYEDLDGHFAEVVPALGRVLGRPPQALVRPPRDVNVIPGGPEDPAGLGIPPDREALQALCRETVGETMRRLGY